MARIEQILAGEKSWGDYSIDVLGHTALGLAYSLPVVWLNWFLGWGWGRGFWLGATAALIGGGVREWLQFRKSGKLHALDRSLDIAHHSLGVPLAILIVWIFV